MTQARGLTCIICTFTLLHELFFSKHQLFAHAMVCMLSSEVVSNL